jgi:hypothetical protein
MVPDGTAYGYTQELFGARPCIRELYSTTGWYSLETSKPFIVSQAHPRKGIHWLKACYPGPRDVLPMTLNFQYTVVYMKMLGVAKLGVNLCEYSSGRVQAARRAMSEAEGAGVGAQALALDWIRQVMLPRVVVFWALLEALSIAKPRYGLVVARELSRRASRLYGLPRAQVTSIQKFPPALGFQRILF